MSLVVSGMDSNPTHSHFYWKPEADPDCDLMFSIFEFFEKSVMRVAIGWHFLPNS